jgi:hypothetical protein
MWSREASRKNRSEANAKEGSNKLRKTAASAIGRQAVGACWIKLGEIIVCTELAMVGAGTGYFGGDGEIRRSKTGSGTIN